MSAALGQVRDTQQRLLLLWVLFALALAVAFAHADPAGRFVGSAPATDTALDAASADASQWREPAIPRVPPAAAPQRADRDDTAPPLPPLVANDEEAPRRSDPAPSSVAAAMRLFLVKAGEARAPPATVLLR